MTAIKKPRGVTQEKILQYILKFQQQNGYSPSVREIADAVGLKSTSTVQGHLVRLQQKGLIKKSSSRSRTVDPTIRNVDYENAVSCRRLPVLGKIAAGQPMLDEEEQGVYIDIPSALLKDSQEYFVLNVSGESMIDAGIMNHDTVVIQRQVEVHNGEIAAVAIHHEVTLKRFYNERTRIRLEPENQRMSPIFADKRDVTILGKAVYVFRKI